MLSHDKLLLSFIIVFGKKIDICWSLFFASRFSLSNSELLQYFTFIPSIFIDNLYNIRQWNANDVKLLLI